MPPMETAIPALVAGALVGATIGFAGIGGGILIFPIVTILFGLDPVSGVATSFVFSLVSRVGALHSHLKLKNVEVRLALWISAGGLPTIIAMSTALREARELPWVQSSVRWAFLGVVCLTFLAMFLGRKPASEEDEEEDSQPIEVKILPALSCGVILGLIVGATSVGGGVATIPMLIHIFRASTRQAVGTSTLVTMILAAAGGIVQIPNVAGWLALFLITSATPAALIGARLTERASERTLDLAVASVMLLAIVSQLWKLLS